MGAPIGNRNAAGKRGGTKVRYAKAKAGRTKTVITKKTKMPSTRIKIEKYRQFKKAQAAGKVYHIGKKSDWGY